MSDGASVVHQGLFALRVMRLSAQRGALGGATRGPVAPWIGVLRHCTTRSMTTTIARMWDLPACSSPFEPTDGRKLMPAFPRELSPEDCRSLIAERSVGRVAFQSASGQQHIVPVSFQLDGDSVVFRTSPASELGRLASGAEAAFEVDDLDVENRSGWSVVAKGRIEVIPDNFETAAIRFFGKDPTPWAAGVRRLYLRLTWRELTGRELSVPWWF